MFPFAELSTSGKACIFDNKCATINIATYSSKESERERDKQKEKAKRERGLRDRELSCIRGDTNTCKYVPRTVIHNKYVSLNIATYSRKRREKERVKE